MGFTTYASTDASAPVLTGENGKLVALLHACLVTGYGAKSAAGWSSTFTAANKEIYRQGAGSQFYLRVQDDGPGTGAAREARMIGYKAVSDVDTGTDPFPTAAQLTNGTICRKSETADATARAWYLFADSRTFYLMVSWNGGVYGSFVFGDFYSTASGDTHNCQIIGRIAEAAAGAAVTGERLDVFSAINAAVTGSFIARSYTNLGTSVLQSRHGDGVKGSTTVNVGTLPYPNAGDNGLYLSKVFVGESVLSNTRGRMRGYWHFLHPQASVNTGDICAGTGAMAGKTFVFFRSGNTGVHVFETSDTLETN